MSFKRIYRSFVLPVLLGGFRVLSPFSSKIKIGLADRKGLSERVSQYRNGVVGKPVLLFHCASAGEFEALRPLAREFDRDKISLAVSFFSPSARKAVEKSTEFDFADYSPVDSLKDVDDYLDRMRPSVIAITKHDVWPNFVWSAQARKIPVFLINGNFHSKSLKMWPLIRNFHREVYSAFTSVMTVSEEDRQRAIEIIGPRIPVENIGDSRYDQTVSRAEKNVEFPDGLKEACQNRTVLVAGSTHFDDENLMVPTLAQIKKRVPSLLTLMVPHDPSPKARDRILDFCKQSGMKVVDLDSGESLKDTEVILINRTGILADLYRLGDVAYVGGGFGKGVHSVLEPMVHGLPVICGPNIEVSNEARIATKRNLVVVVEGRGQTENTLLEWLTDEPKLADLHKKSKAFVLENAGSSRRVANKLKEALVGCA